MGEDEAPPPPPQMTVLPAPQSINVSAQQAAQAQTQAFKDLIPLLPEYAQTLTDIQRTQAPQLGEINIREQETTAPRLVRAALENLKIADPTGLAAREALGKEVLSGLSPERFGKLSDAEKRNAEQDVRAGQVARGGGTGLGDSLDEAIAKYALGNQRQQQQLGNVSAFLGGRDPQQSFDRVGAPVQTQNVNAMAGNLFPSTNALISQSGANYGAQVSGILGQDALAQRKYEYVDQNTSNPFLTGLAAFGSFAAEAAPKSISV